MEIDDTQEPPPLLKELAAQHMVSATVTAMLIFALLTVLTAIGFESSLGSCGAPLLN